jgi:hypothetical protein
MNSAHISLIRILAKQAVREYLAGKPAPLSENRPIRTNRPVPSLAEKK